MKRSNPLLLAQVAPTDFTSLDVNSPTPAPTNLSSGIQEITWTGFAGKTVTFKTPIDQVLTLPPIKVNMVGTAAIVFYNDAVQVEAKYIPQKNGLSLDGPWFVQRRVLNPSFGKGGNVEVISTSNLVINSQGLAVGQPGGFAMDLSKGLVLDYRLGRYVTVFNGPPGANGFPTPKKVLQFLDTSAYTFVTATLGKPAHTVNQYRPLPCEFETVKFEILGKQGQVLQTLKAGEETAVKVDINEAKTKIGPPDNLLLTYAARWTVRRINPPNFSPTQGYVVQWGRVGNVFIAELSPVLAGLDLTGKTGKEFTLSFDIKRAVNSGETTRQLCLGNAVTNSKFIGQHFASIQAETNLRLNW